MEKTVKFNKVQYAKLKNLAYMVYRKDYDQSDDKAQKIMNDLVKQYHNEELTNLISNTLLFPFDLELYQFLLNKNFSEESILTASEKYHITVDLIKQKIKEYICYGFMKGIEDKLIDYHTIDEIGQFSPNEDINSAKKQN